MQDITTDKVSIEYKPTVLYEKETDYWKDYNYGQTQESLTIGNEVATPKSKSGTINTADSFSSVDNSYTLSVASLTSTSIFSLGIDGMNKAFQPTSYAILETQLQDWLGIDYEVTYISGTNYTILRTNGDAISKTSPNLVRTITLTSFDSISVVDVIVDGVTVSLNGATHSGSASTAITYLKSQLSSSLYYMNDNSNVLTIARKDGAIPAISKTQYNFYSYGVNYSYSDTPSSGQYWEYTDTTIDGIAYHTYGSQLRPFYGDRIIRNLVGGTQLTESGGSGSDNGGGWTIFKGCRVLIHSRSHLTTVTKDSGCTATRAVLKDTSGTILATANFSGDNATFDYWLDGNTSYDIGADSNGASYTLKYAGNTSGWPQYFDLTTWNTTIGINNILRITLEPQMDTTGYIVSGVFNKTSGYDTVWNSANTAQYFNKTHTLNIYKTDYSSITFSSDTKYTNSGSFPNDNGQGYSITTTNHNADITTATFTEISITLTLSTNNYFIPCAMKIKKIDITAVASGGSSVGSYTYREGNSCTAKYSTTTAFVTDKIFKTDASNTGYVVGIRTNGFIMNWTTNTSNKLDYICT